MHKRRYWSCHMSTCALLGVWFTTYNFSDPQSTSKALADTVMQRTAALQQGKAISQPVRSSAILLPLPGSCALRPAFITSHPRRRLSSLQCHQQQRTAVAPATAASSSLRPFQLQRCRQQRYRQQFVCNASGSEQQPASLAATGSGSSAADQTATNSSSITSSSAQDPTTSSSTSSSQTVDAAAATPAEASAVPAAAAAAAAEASVLTVEAVQSDPAATIDAIQRLTRSSQDDTSPAATAAAAAAAVSDPARSSSAGESQQELQQQQNALDAFVAAIAKAWAGVQVHWQAAVGFLAAAAAAVKASLAKFPAWVAAQKLQKLQEAADAAPTDAGQQAAYLAALNSNAHPR